MKTTYHLSISLRDALNWPDHKLNGVFQDSDGKSLTPIEARAALMLEIAKGREKIPVCECNNFDNKRGCRGHRVGENEEESE